MINKILCLFGLHKYRDYEMHLWANKYDQWIECKHCGALKYD